MAIETHNVTPDDVLDQLPFAQPGSVTATSDGLSTTEIESYIRQYAGRVNAVISGRDEIPDPAEIGEDLTEVVRAYILAGAKKLAIEKREFDEDRVDRLRDEASDLLDIIRSHSVDMGDDYDASDVVEHNIDTSEDKPKPTFSGQRGDIW